MFRIFHLLLHPNKIIMEEFGDWIYFLVIIIAGVASLISSTRKKAQQAAGQNKPREIITNKSDREVIWDDYFPQTENKAEEVILPKSQSLQSYAATKQNKQYFNFYQEGQPALQREESKPLEIEDNLATITIDDLPANTDDWRKAFIYNEIFNRKN